MDDPTAASQDADAPPEDLKQVPYSECLRKVDVIIRKVTNCDDVDEHVRLVQNAERWLSEARRRVAEAEGTIQRLLASDEQRESTQTHPAER